MLSKLLLNEDVRSRERSTTDAELFSCTDTHHFIRGEVDETRQDEEITGPETSDKEKCINEHGNEADTVAGPTARHLLAQAKTFLFIRFDEMKALFSGFASFSATNSIMGKSGSFFQSYLFLFEQR